MISEATLMQANTSNEQQEENTVLREEKNNEMETEAFLHDNVGFYVLSDAQLFYTN